MRTEAPEVIIHGRRAFCLLRRDFLRRRPYGSGGALRGRLAGGVPPFRRR
jgi:hypothetical protein